MSTLHRDLRLLLVNADRHLLIRSTTLQSQNGFRRLSRLAVVDSSIDARGDVAHRHYRQTTDLGGIRQDWTPQGTSASLNSKQAVLQWALPFGDVEWGALTPKSGRFLRLKHTTLGANPILGQDAKIEGLTGPGDFSGQVGSAFWTEGHQAPKRAIQICVTHPTFSCVAQVLPRPKLLGYQARLGAHRGHSKNLWDNLRGRVTLEKDFWRSQMQLGDLTAQVELRPVKKFGYQIIGENSDGAPHVVSIVPFCETEVHVYQGTKLQATHRLGRVGTLLQSSEEPDPYSAPLN